MTDEVVLGICVALLVIAAGFLVRYHHRLTRVRDLCKHAASSTSAAEGQRVPYAQWVRDQDRRSAEELLRSNEES